MRRLFLPFVALLAAAAPGEAPFEPSPERFSDAAACRAHLGTIVAEARRAGFDAAVGPYALAPADLRAHTVRAEGSGHRISEYRCDAARLSARSWIHSMAPPEEAFTVESVARGADWLKHRGRQQQ